MNDSFILLNYTMKSALISSAKLLLVLTTNSLLSLNFTTLQLISVVNFAGFHILYILSKSHFNLLSLFFINNKQSQIIFNAKFMLIIMFLL